MHTASKKLWKKDNDTEILGSRERWKKNFFF